MTIWGMATANSLAGIEAGARQIECTINGLGERAGNAALEEVVMAINVRGDRLAYRTGIDATRLTQASRLVSAASSFAVQPNKAIVGRNAFAHESGIHQGRDVEERVDVRDHDSGERRDVVEFVGNGEAFGSSCVREEA